MEEHKISKSAAVIMIIFAFIFDLANIVVDFVTMGIGGFFMGAVTAMVFSVWFSHYGVSMTASRNVARFLLTIVLSAFPGTDLLFPWTVNVGLTVYLERKRESMAEKHDAKKPLRQSGWRL